MRPSRIMGILLVVNWVLLTPAVWGAEVKDVAYRSGDETVHGLMFAPSGKGPFPGLLAIHAVFGLDAWTKEQASKLADAGYVVLALDFYQGKVAKTLDEGVQLSRAVPTSRKQQDVLAAIQFLRSQANVSQDRVGSIGWCMGGRWAFQLATLDPLLKAAVVRYGSVSSDPSVLAKINARILGIFGGKDGSIPIAEIRSFDQQMKGLGKQAEIVIYPEAGHAFEYPEPTAKELGLVRAAYSADAAYQGPRPDDTADAWKRTVDFLDANLKSDKSDSDAEREVLALEEQMEALLRSNSAERTALWAEDMVYINNDGAVFDKARLAPAVSAGEVKIESLEVTERKIRVYGDVAVVTALEHRRASFHKKETREFLQRFTRVWARRSGKWQMVSFQATRISEPTVYALQSEGGAPEKPQTGPNPGTDMPGSDRGLEQQIVSLDEEFEEYRKRDQAGDKMLADDYIGVSVSGRTLDKAGTIELFRSGRVQTNSLEISGRNVRLYGDTALVIVTRSLNDAIAGIPRQERHRCTKVWAKRNGQWQVVSFQATKITGP